MRFGLLSVGLPLKGKTERHNRDGDLKMSKILVVVENLELEAIEVNGACDGCGEIKLCLEFDGEEPGQRERWCEACCEISDIYVSRLEEGPSPKEAKDIKVGDEIWQLGNDSYHTVRRVVVGRYAVKIWAGSLYSGDEFLPNRIFQAR